MRVGVQTALSLCENFGGGGVRIALLVTNLRVAGKSQNSLTGVTEGVRKASNNVNARLEIPLLMDFGR